MKHRDPILWVEAMSRGPPEEEAIDQHVVQVLVATNTGVGAAHAVSLRIPRTAIAPILAPM